MLKRWPAAIFVVFIVIAISGCIAPESEWTVESHAQEHDGGDGSEDQSCETDETDEMHGSSHENRTRPADAYNDSSPRFHNTVDGREDSKRTVDVPLGADRLRVALIHDSDGKVTFSFHKPGFILGGTVAEEEVNGEKYMDEPEWVVIHDPLPGEWTLNIDVNWKSESSYTIGVYLD